ncbi:luciferase family protein [Streptacidiphilus monticola]
MARSGHRPSSCGTGSALRAGHRELVHMHGSREADVRLTADLIARLHDQLSHSTAVRLHDDSVWVTVHLDCDDDADLLVTLTSLSLQAHAPATGSSPARRAPNAWSRAATWEESTSFVSAPTGARGTARAAHH